MIQTTAMAIFVESVLLTAFSRTSEVPNIVHGGGHDSIFGMSYFLRKGFVLLLYLPSFSSKRFLAFLELRL